VWTGDFDLTLAPFVQKLTVSTKETFKGEDLVYFTSLKILIFDRNSTFNQPLHHLPPTLRLLFLPYRYDEPSGYLPRGSYQIQSKGLHRKPIELLKNGLRSLVTASNFERSVMNLPPDFFRGEMRFYIPNELLPSQQPSFSFKHKKKLSETLFTTR
jgi:hypothetical protein